MSSQNELHDEYDDKGYKRRCFCQKCTGQFKHWCAEHRDQKDCECQKRSYTVVEYKCHETQLVHKKFGYHEKFESKWEHVDCENVKQPKHCKCGKPEESCSCSSSSDKTSHSDHKDDKHTKATKATKATKHQKAQVRK